MYRNLILKESAKILVKKLGHVRDREKNQPCAKRTLEGKEQRAQRRVHQGQLTERSTDIETFLFAV